MRYFFPLSLLIDPFGGYKTITQKAFHQNVKNERSSRRTQRKKEEVQEIVQKDKEIAAEAFKQIEQNWNAGTPLNYLVNMIKYASLLGLDYQIHKDKLIHDILREKFKNLPDINVKNNKGDTLLHIIASAGDENFASLALFTQSADIDYNLLNRAGKSALHIAVEKGAAESIKLLQLHTTDLTIWQSFIQKEYHKQYDSISKIKGAIQTNPLPYKNAIIKPEYFALYILNKEWEQPYTNLRNIYQDMSLPNYKKADKIDKEAELNLINLSVFFTFPDFFEFRLNYNVECLPQIGPWMSELILFTVEHNKRFTNKLFEVIKANTISSIEDWCISDDDVYGEEVDNQHIYKQLTLFFLTHPRFAEIANDEEKLSLIENLFTRYCSQEERQALKSNKKVLDCNAMQKAIIKSLRSTMQLEKQNNLSARFWSIKK